MSRRRIGLPGCCNKQAIPSSDSIKVQRFSEKRGFFYQHFDIGTRIQRGPGKLHGAFPQKPIRQTGSLLPSATDPGTGLALQSIAKKKPCWKRCISEFLAKFAPAGWLSCPATRRNSRQEYKATPKNDNNENHLQPLHPIRTIPGHQPLRHPIRTQGIRGGHEKQHPDAQRGNQSRTDTHGSNAGTVVYPVLPDIHLLAHQALVQDPQQHRSIPSEPIRTRSLRQRPQPELPAGQKEIRLQTLYII